jgi:hypothetical protein
VELFTLVDCRCCDRQSVHVRRRLFNSSVRLISLGATQAQPSTAMTRAAKHTKNVPIIAASVGSSAVTCDRRVSPQLLLPWFWLLWNRYV